MQEHPPGLKRQDWHQKQIAGSGLSRTLPDTVIQVVGRTTGNL
jgi:hypothetical protein